MIVLNYILFIIIGYLLGSLNFSLVIGQLFYKTDIRKYGSKNAGATNVQRTLGTVPAIIVLILDAIKGIIAFFIAFLFTHDYSIAYLSATVAVLGHIFPVFFGFRGGKGVVTTLGAIICLNPIIGSILVVVILSLIALTRYVSFAALTTFVLSIVLFILFDGSPLKVILVSILAIIIIVKHLTNIKRLINRTENKLSFKKTI